MESSTESPTIPENFVKLRPLQRKDRR